MAASPVILGLKHRLNRHRNKTKSGYQAFTTEFDEVVEAESLSTLLSELPMAEKKSLDGAMKEFELSLSQERVVLHTESAKLVRKLKARLNDVDRSTSVVSFLIDHSGSMRSARMISALLAVEIAVDALCNAKIASEILGFTTTSWHGGKSRTAWKWAGAPRNPGRLCDLRHVVYGDVNRPASFPWDIRMALHADFLRENIDGEALEWAATRLRNSDFKRKIIIHISDGAPVDDSTMLHNDDDNLLNDHLDKVREKLEAEQFVLGALLLGEEYASQPEILGRADEPLEAGLSLLGILSQSLTS